jgi:hypothetical protein
MTETLQTEDAALPARTEAKGGRVQARELKVKY